MPTQCNTKPLEFESRRVSDAFAGGPIESDVGPLGVSDPALSRHYGIVADRYSRYSTTFPIPPCRPIFAQYFGSRHQFRKGRFSCRAELRKINEIVHEAEGYRVSDQIAL